MTTEKEKAMVGTTAKNIETINGYKDTDSVPMVSIFAACIRPGEHVEDITIDDFLNEIKSGKYKSQQGYARGLLNADPDEYKIYKRSKIPAATINGTCTYRRNQGFVPNGFACLEADAVDALALAEKLTRDPYVYALSQSLSGAGVWWLVRISDATLFNEMHTSLREYFYEKYGVDAKADEGAKSLSNFRIACYDPNLYRNEKAMVWKNLPIHKPKKKTAAPKKENNHYAHIMPLVAKMGHNGYTDEEIRDRLTNVPISPDSCLTDPEKMEELIASMRKAYTEGKEGNSQNVVQYCGFWTNNFKTSDCQLSTGLLTDVLTALGWRILNNEFVQVVDGVVSLKDPSELYQYIINLVSSKDVTFDVKDIKITIDRTTLKTRAQKELRGGVKMLALKKFDYIVLRDTATEIYFHFTNCSMRITTDSICLFTRSSEEGVVWAEQLLPHTISEDDLQRPVFADFIMNVADPQNFNSFRSAIGRALHNHNGAEGMRVPWLCDESAKAGKSNGRTGKSLITKAIGRCRKMDDCHGKDFRPDNQFKFQNMTQSTQVYVIDDVKENFDFRTLYNVTSEGMEYERKNRDRVRLTLKETPQLLVTSNHPPQIEQGASTTGRLFILPVKDFYQKYADNGGVKAYHKQTFFDDWDHVEWNRFFWFMAVCAQFYLQEGYVFADQSQIRKNRLKEICSKKLKSKELGDDFVDFIYSKELKGTFQLDSIIQDFGNGDIDKQLFSQCLTAYFDIEKIEFTKAVVRQDGAQKRVWVVA
jgi:hypothetical protein